MPITSASQHAAHDFLPGRNATSNRLLYLTLLVSTALGFVVTLILYAWLTNGQIWPRLGYAIFVSLMPALGTLFLFKLTRLFLSWQLAAMVYLALFLLVLIIQGFGRMIPI